MFLKDLLLLITLALMQVIQQLIQWMGSIFVIDKYQFHLHLRRKQKEKGMAHGKVVNIIVIIIIIVVIIVIIIVVIIVVVVIIVSCFLLLLERYLAKQNPLLQTDKPHQLFADAPPKAPTAGCCCYCCCCCCYSCFVVVIKE